MARKYSNYCQRSKSLCLVTDIEGLFLHHAEIDRGAKSLRILKSEKTPGPKIEGYIFAMVKVENLVSLAIVKEILYF